MFLIIIQISYIVYIIYILFNIYIREFADKPPWKISLYSDCLLSIALFSVIPPKVPN